jgi:DNA-binding NarL/FixJ family response regulator
LVDNHRLFREALTLRLQIEPGFKIVGAVNSASEAISFVVQDSPDLVIMDLSLLGEDGLRATRRILQSNPTVKVLVLTGAPDASAAHDALVAGSSGFLRKTETSAELVRAVRVVMSGNTYLSLDASTAVTDVLAAESSAPRERGLSEREIAVLRGLADGLGYKEIASRLLKNGHFLTSKVVAD